MTQFHQLSVKSFFLLRRFVDVVVVMQVDAAGFRDDVPFIGPFLNVLPRGLNGSAVELACCWHSSYLVDTAGFRDDVPFIGPFLSVLPRGLNGSAVELVCIVVNFKTAEVCVNGF